MVVAIGAPEGVHPVVHRVERTLESVITAMAGLPVDNVVIATRDERARKVARSVRLVLGPERLGLLHLDVPVTAWALVLAGLATQGLTASAARAVADVVLARTTTRALLSSVASLERPAPTFRQHAGSLVPGTAFVVDPGRGTVGRFQERLGIPGSGDHLVVARSAKPVVPDADGLLPRLADTELTALTGAEAGWPAARWFEASVIDGLLGGAVASATSGSYGWAACEVCGRAASTACIFCDIAVRPARTGPSHQNRHDHQGVIS